MGKGIGQDLSVDIAKIINKYKHQVKFPQQTQNIGLSRCHKHHFFSQED